MDMKMVMAKGSEAVVVATGVKGGGYISIYTQNPGAVPISTSPTFYRNEVTGDLNYIYLSAWSVNEKIYLNEGEKLYGKMTGSSGNPYYVTYYNDEPSSQSQPQVEVKLPPINLSGTIQLNQQ